MLDMVGAIYVTVYMAVQAILLLAFLRVRRSVRAALFLGAAAWVAVIASLYAAGGLPFHLPGPIPVNLLPFAIFTMVLFGSWLFLPVARDAFASIPLPAMIGVHIGRIGGWFFLLLYANGRLSAPFGPVAGIGDIITGAIALALVVALISGKQVRPSWIAGWNAFGAADLLVAISLALLSAPGVPFRAFVTAPGAQVMGVLPWLFVPAILVPVDLLAHALIAQRLGAAARQAYGRTPVFVGLQK